jgi:para-aminobenzoate synthetase/4-amino-4-deoxychorismate lyase
MMVSFDLVAMKVNEAVLYDSAKKRWLHFESPRQIVEVWRVEELLEGLHRVEEAVEHQGLCAAGFVSYEAAPAFDPALMVKGVSGFPLLWFGLYDRAREIEISLPREKRPTSVPPHWIPSITAEQYREALKNIREYIRNGDTYQVNFTFRLRAPFISDLWSTFVWLLAAQEPAFGGFLLMEDWAICSASPELFFRLDQNRIESCPMKGTASRGLTYKEDMLQAEALRVSEKNRAENVMIVDMVRNDIGRIAETGSVDVNDLFAIEKYSTLWQMTSTVQAETRMGLTDIFKAMFPPASITGAPKVRTMEIIAELESEPRRIYTGSIGFMKPERQAQFNVAIRTLLIDRKRGQLEYGLGGGIVWDSIPNMELQECWMKARVLEQMPDSFFLLETMLWTPDEGFYLIEQHLKRIAQSAVYFDFSMDMKQIHRHLKDLSDRLPRIAHKIRLLVAKDGKCTWQSEIFEKAEAGSFVCVALARSPVDRSNPFLYHKTTNRIVYEKALAPCPGYEDVIMYNEMGEVTESTIANVVVEIDGTLYTPPVHCGLLPGTYRAWLLEQGMVKEMPITIDQVLQSSQVFLINSVRGMYGVSVVQTEKENVRQQVTSPRENVMVLWQNDIEIK